MASTKELQIILIVGSTLFVTVALLMMSIPIFYQNKLQKRKKQEALRLLFKVLEVEKQTRQQLAADIHDGMASELSAVYHIVNFIKRSPSADHGILLDEVSVCLSQIIESTRQLSHSLVPPTLESFGLSRAIREYLDKINQSGSIQCTLLDKGVNVQLISDEISYHMYRITQELVQNLLKYAPGAQCSICIFINNNDFSFIYQDTSTPFDFMEIARQSEGNGLNNILARVRAINGVLQQELQASGNKITITCTL